MPPEQRQDQGELSLTTLLSTLKTTLHPHTFVFVTIPDSHQYSASLPIPLSAIQMSFREAEGLTLILPESQASDHFSPDEYRYRSRMVTLDVHSSLEAVGFMAVVMTRLTEHGISVNPVSGVFHDHLFVPVERADEVVAVLEQLAGESNSGGTAK